MRVYAAFVLLAAVGFAQPQEVTVTTFVRGHGSFHDGTTWTAVRDHLARRGHPSIAPTLAGHGKGTLKIDVEHPHSVSSVVNAIVEADLDDVVLVGHSFGGGVIQRVAERIPERLRRLVFQHAFVYRDGESLLDNCPVDYAELFTSLAAGTSDATVLEATPDATRPAASAAACSKSIGHS